MPTFAPETIQKMEEKLHEVQASYENHAIGYIRHRFVQDRARELAHHGFLRRLDTLRSCIETVFELLPPDGEDIPEKEVLKNATTALQAFVINVFGCLDNLAWVLVLELEIKRADGADIPATQIGLRANNLHVRAGLSREFQDNLNEKEEWLRNLESYRHSLAHRVPLYVPPYVVLNENVSEYERLENAMNDALRAGQLDLYERLRGDQKALCFFKPVMGHSFYEQSPKVYFHPQMLADYLTIDELANFTIEELRAHQVC